MISQPCFSCGAPLEADDLTAYGRVALAHARAAHADLAEHDDMAVRNDYEGRVRLTGGSDRLDTIGPVEVHPVTEDRLDDWLAFFDHDAQVTTPEESACYCLEPHEMAPGRQPPARHWRERRADMIDLFRAGAAFGYLAYVDGRPVGWVSAARRGDYALFRRGDERDGSTVGVACFTIAPPYRGHGIARALLDRVIADAAARGATGVEAYPLHDGIPGDGFRGGRPMYDAAGFSEVKVRRFDTVMRRDTFT
ncbi:MAG TPA: GNAT family N-acetyltransferase [Acidimicrobiales bacterium]|nr:GNAT family N-acetyltransferase [Acidimicrobiales bacterium]